MVTKMKHARERVGKVNVVLELPKSVFQHV